MGWVQLLVIVISLLLLLIWSTLECESEGEFDGYESEEASEVSLLEGEEIGGDQLLLS